jgi:nitrous oxide reductase accessory protein NosL
MKFSQGLLLGCLVAGFALLTACGGSNEINAPEIFYGQDICEECSMIISDANFAAATIDLKGNAHKFDDIGGMLIYHMDHPEFQVRAYFVHDYQTGAWLRGETAFYVRANLPDAPMGDGIVAFADRATAENFADRMRGQVFKFDELRVNAHLTLHTAP